MSFEELKVPELRTVAEAFGVSQKPVMKKVDLIKAIEDEGVTFEDYEALLAAKLDSSEIVKDPSAPTIGSEDPKVLVKMERRNPYFEYNGYTFEQRRPFVIMLEDDANELFDTHEGFRVANPREAKEFYS